MDKLFVPYELAKQLKEKGFNESCLCFYNKEDDKYKLAICAQFDSYNFATYKNDDIIKSSCKGILTTVCAPSHQQVIDWFREQYNIHISISYELHMKWFYSIDIASYTDEDMDNNCFEKFCDKVIECNCIDTDDGFETYYDALNIAIEESIKLI